MDRCLVFVLAGRVLIPPQGGTYYKRFAINDEMFSHASGSDFPSCGPRYRTKKSPQINLRAVHFVFRYCLPEDLKAYRDSVEECVVTVGSCKSGKRSHYAREVI